MSTMNIELIREEINNLLRNSDIFTIANRGVTTTTDTFTATAGQTVFTTTHAGLRNIRSLTVNSVSKYFIKDYSVNWTTNVITLSTGALIGEAVVINYDYGTSDKIFPDMPRDDLTLTSFPRIGISLVNISTNPIGLYGLNHVSDVAISIYCWVPANKDTNIGAGIGGTKDLNDLMTKIRDVIRQNSKSLYNFQYITPIGSARLIAGQNNKIIQMSQDFMIKFLFEIG